MIASERKSSAVMVGSALGLPLSDTYAIYSAWKRDRSRSHSVSAVSETTVSLGSVAAHIGRRLVLALAQINHMPEQTVRRPLDVADLDDHLRPHPMYSRQSSGDPKRLPRGGAIASGIVSTASGWSRCQTRSSSATGIPLPARPA